MLWPKPNIQKGHFLTALDTPEILPVQKNKKQLERLCHYFTKFNCSQQQ